MSKYENKFIVIENGHLQEYILDNKNIWKIGRKSKDNIPDISLHSPTISRKHGQLQCEDGIWFYVDSGQKNGTFYNEKHIDRSRSGSSLAVFLEDGDTLVFGGGKERVINNQTVWAMYIENKSDEAWKVVDTSAYEKVIIDIDGDKDTVDILQKGYVKRKNDCIAIYMGGRTYISGDVCIEGR